MFLLLICFSSCRKSFKLRFFFAGALLFVTLVTVTSPASDSFSVIVLLLPSMFSTPSEICVSDDWKGVRFERHLSFGED